MTCPADSPTQLTGYVFDPSGQVPLYNAIVYIPNAPLSPLPTGMTCDQCGSLVSGDPVAIALTGPDGRFELNDIPFIPNIPLVIQLGKWRRQVTVPFSGLPCSSQSITDFDLTRLPRNQSEGDLPRLAIATGTADPIECLFLKLGISTTEMTHPADNGSIHFYRDNGLRNDAGFLTVSALVGDAGTLGRYDMVFLPCTGREPFSSNPGPLQRSWTQNIIDYTSAGGRLSTTHFGYAWMAYAQQPFPSTASWAPDPTQSHNPPNPFTVDVNQSFPKGAAFADWLWDTGTPLPGFGQLAVAESRHDVAGTNGGTTAWLSGINPTNDAGLSVQTLTFNTPYGVPPFPDGDAGTQCGRVMFSDFHMTASALVSPGVRNGVFPHDCAPGPITPQEKALLFMLFDLSSCVQSDQLAPAACKRHDDPCTRPTDCCSGFTCLSPTQGPCFGGACTCQ